MEEEPDIKNAPAVENDHRPPGDKTLEEVLAELQRMEKVAKYVEEHTVEIQELKQQVTKNTTKLTTFIQMTEEWHKTLSDLSNTNQHLEERVISTMHNWFKDLELKMQQKVEGDLSGAISELVTSEEVATLKEMAAQHSTVNTTHSITLKKLETDIQVLQEKVDIPTTVNTNIKRNFYALRDQGCYEN